MMPDVQIRPARDADLTAIEALLTESQLPTAGVKDALCGFLVAEAETRVVGVVGMEKRGRYGLLRSTAVAPEWRGRQVAKRLVEQIIADAESQGVNALYLLTTTAERYFPNFGFEVTARDVVPQDIKATEEFSEACPTSATVMCLTFKA
jgi:amino-acid N-acetyltransferase